MANILALLRAPDHILTNHNNNNNNIFGLNTSI